MLPRNFHRLPVYRQVPMFIARASLADWAPILLAVGAFLFLGLMGNMAYEDARTEEAHYIDMVCNGYWPDYENRKPVCE